MPRRERRRSHPSLGDSGQDCVGLGTGPHAAMSTPRRTEDISELIHFVRNCQGVLQRECTEMKLLQRKVPLPDIGHHNGAYEPIGGGKVMPHPDQITTGSLDTETTDTDHAYESDLEPELDFPPPRIRTPSPPRFTDTPSVKLNHSGLTGRSSVIIERCSSVNPKAPFNPCRLSKSLEGIPESAPMQRTRLKPLPKYCAEPGQRRLTARVHHLPPVGQDLPDRPQAPALSPRDVHYSRPSAPSPSVTPPIPTDEDALTIPIAMDEPVDYLDLH